jgi:hypothetical protein
VSFGLGGRFLISATAPTLFAIPFAFSSFRSIAIGASSLPTPASIFRSAFLLEFFLGFTRAIDLSHPSWYLVWNLLWRIHCDFGIVPRKCGISFVRWSEAKREKAESIVANCKKKSPTVKKKPSLTRYTKGPTRMTKGTQPHFYSSDGHTKGIVEGPIGEILIFFCDLAAFTGRSAQDQCLQ